jgi:hypothetical protein
MSGIFISYRREDSSGYSGRLFDRLTAQFNRDQLFMDIDAIEPGVDFVEVIERAVSSCDVLVAVIGKQWLTVTDANGRRRLDNPEDFIRLEVGTALDRGIRVIPVLVRGAEMPSSDDLPDALTSLSRRNALEISDARWDYDVGRLIEILEKDVGRASPESPPPTGEEETGLVPVPPGEPEEHLASPLDIGKITKIDSSTWQWQGVLNADAMFATNLAQQALKSLDPQSVVSEGGPMSLMAKTKPNMRSYLAIGNFGFNLKKQLQSVDPRNACEEVRIRLNSESGDRTLVTVTSNPFLGTNYDWEKSKENIRRVVAWLSASGSLQE